MKILLVVNPSASSVTPRTQVVIQKALSADHEVDVVHTSRRGHAARLAQGAARDGTDVVVVLGGDGTLNEAANGVAQTRVALAPLPGGSTNVFARTVGLPDDAVEATSVLLDALAAGSIRSVGLGSVNSRYFLFHVGVGLDAAVIQQVEKHGQLKRYASHPLFVFASIDTWLRHYDRNSPQFAVVHPDGTTVPNGRYAICLNTDPYTYIGSHPLRIAPEATLDRGLALLTIQSLRLGRSMAIGAAALAGHGRLRRMRDVDYRSDLAEFTIRGYRPFPYQVDGDYLGEVRSLAFRHEPDALELVVPPDQLSAASSSTTRRATSG